MISNRAEAREVTGAFSENVRGLRVFTRNLQQRRAIRRSRDADASARPTGSPPPLVEAPVKPAEPVPPEAVP